MTDLNKYAKDSGYFDQVKPEDDRYEFTKGVTSALSSTVSGGKALVGAVTGDENLQLRSLDDMRQNSTDNAGKVGRIEDIEGVGDFTDWLSYNLGSGTASIATMVAGGGLGGLALKGAAKGALVNAGKTLGATSTGFAPNYGESLQSAYGTTGEIKNQAALASASIKTALDFIVPAKLLKAGIGKEASKEYSEIAKQKMINDKGFVTWAKEALKTGKTEAFTEGLQTYTDQVMNNILTEGDNPLAVRSGSEIFNAMAAGGAGSMGIGAYSGYQQNRNAEALRNQSSDVNGQVDDLWELAQTDEVASKRVNQWQQKRSDVAKTGVRDLIAQGASPEEANAEMRKSLILSAKKQGMSDLNAISSADNALTMTEVEIMQDNAPEFFEELNGSEASVDYDVPTAARNAGAKNDLEAGKFGEALESGEPLTIPNREAPKGKENADYDVPAAARNAGAKNNVEAGKFGDWITSPLQESLGTMKDQTPADMVGEASSNTGYTPQDRTVLEGDVLSKEQSSELVNQRTYTGINGDFIEGESTAAKGKFPTEQEVNQRQGRDKAKADFSEQPAQVTDKNIVYGQDNTREVDGKVAQEKMVDGIKNQPKQITDKNIIFAKDTDELGKVHVKANGKPFKNERLLKISRGYKEAVRQKEPVEVIAHEGGLAWRYQPKSEKSSEATAPISGPKAIDEAAHEAATSPMNDLAEPTIAQAEANNYKLGRIVHSGIKIGIENPQGSYRKGIDGDGKKWSNKINHHYGDVTGSKGADGDALDVFVNPNTESSTNAYIVDQVEPKTGAFDEHKIMLGFDSKDDAEKAYLSNYDKGWKGVGAISEVPIETFKGWVEKGNTIQAYKKPDTPQEQTPQETASQKAVVVSEAKETDVNLTSEGDIPQETDMFGDSAPVEPKSQSKIKIGKIDTDDWAEHLEDADGDIEQAKQDYNDSSLEAIDYGINEIDSIDSPSQVALAADEIQKYIDAGVTGYDEIAVNRILRANKKLNKVQEPETAQDSEPSWKEWMGKDEQAQLSVTARAIGDLEERIVLASEPFSKKKYQKELAERNEQREMLLSGMTIEEILKNQKATETLGGETGVIQGIERTTTESLNDEAEQASGPISGNRKLLDFMVQEIKKSYIANNNDLKAVGKRYYGLEKALDVTPQQLKLLQEAFETVNVIKRRASTQNLLGTLKNKDAAVLKVFNGHVKAYEGQPNLDVRTKKSVEFQAYSTPSPMSFLSNIAAGVDANSTVFEPTAGNGLLLLTSAPENTFANELDPVRADSLAYTGFNVTMKNATNSPFDGWLDGPVDAVLANPPFGRLRDDNGKPTDFTFTDKQGKSRVFKEIDHVIAYQALEAMKDNGKASLILGAPKEASDYKGNNKIFLNWLYQNYNVQHHIEADGKLYKGQGAAWPLQMITINGRALEGTGKFAPIKGQIERLTSWEAIYENYKQSGLLDTNNKQFKLGRKSASNLPDSQGAKVVPLSDRANDTGQSDSGVDGNASSRQARPQAVLPDDRSTGASADASVGFDSQPDIIDTGLVKADSKPKTGRTGNTTSEATDSVGLPGQRPSESIAEQKGHSKAPKQISTKVKKINDFQAEYQTASDGFNDKVLTPVNIASYTQSALIDIQTRHGSIDDFVMARLGYDNKKDLHKAFMGLQADSVALAVDAIEKGRGIIIGDQTGVGKGRQAAGIIRYALENGKTPIFVSQKPNLFTDMYDDLEDVGVKGFTPLIVNQDKGYISKDGKKVFNHSSANRKKLMDKVSANRELPKGYDALFLTYSQISSDKQGTKTSMIDGLLDNAILVMDESHTAAGGASKLGVAFQNFVSKAAGVTYLSATYAKRPDNMLLYMRTDLGLATDNYENLVNAVQNGGLGMQTYIASKLAEAGQMVRRERSFEGISIKDAVIKDASGETAKLFDQTTEALRAIQDTSAYWRSYVERDLANDIQRETGLDTRISGNQSDTAINVTLFSSVVHNYIRQLTLGLKAKESAQLAIKAIKDGKRPVIALESTLGSALKAYMDKYGKVTGDHADSLNFSTMLEAVLDNTLAYSTKEPGEKKGVKTVVSIDAVSDPMVQEMYQQAKAAIKRIDASKIPASPIDTIRHEITKAGYSVAEITGRDLIIDYNDNAKIINRPASEDNRRDTVDRFNTSKLDVIILNQAGSTGLSLHASEKLAKEHQKPRYMVIAEPSLDVNVYMQMLGRANRTGQVVPPSYDNAWLDLPSEKRPAAVIARKMKGLNANTSGNIDSATSVESIDILNEYGDEVVRNYAAENRSMLASYNAKLVSLPEEDAANYFLGKVAVLPVKIQDKVLNEIEAAYKDHIAFLDATGQNQLNTKSLDLEARPISQKIIAESRASAGVFAEPVYLTKVEAKAQGKAPSWSEVSDALAESSQAEFDVATQEMQDDTVYSESLSGRLVQLQEKEAEARSEGKKTDGYATQINGIKERQRDFEADKRQIKNDFSEGGTYSHGAFINVMPNESFEKAVHGVIVGLDYKHETGNPTAKSKWKLKVMVADRMRTIPINLSRAQDGVIQGKRWDSQSNMAKMFDQMSQLPQTETRHIMTGNLVEATTSTAKQGRIVPFSTHDNRVIQGLLLPASFNADEDVKAKSQATTEESVKWLLNVDDDIFASMGLSTNDKAVTVRRKRWEEGYSVEMPKSAAKGKKYWGNEAIEAVIGEQAVKGGGTFSVNLTKEQVMPFAKAMKAINPLSVQGQVQIKSFNKMFGKESNDFAKQDIVFSRDKSAGVVSDSGSVGVSDATTVSQADADIVVDRIISDWDGGSLRKDDFIVVSTFDELPQNIKDAAKDQGAENQVGGVFHRGKTYLVRDKLKDQQEVETTIFHETYGHHGIRKLFGKEIAQKLNQLLVGIGGMKGMDKIAKKYGIDLDAYKEGLAGSTLTNAQAQTILMDELLAHLAENNKPSVMRKVREIIGAVRQWLKNSGFIKLQGVSDSELFYILKQARKAVQGGNGKGGNGDIRFSRVSDVVDKLAPKKQSNTLIANEDEGNINKFIRTIQDKFKPLKTVQNIIEKSGKKISDQENAYVAEELFHGKAEEDLRKMEQDYVQPLVDALMKSKVDMNELDLYLMAKHAKERNAVVSSKNDAFDGESGSGMTNDEAQAILDKATGDGRTKALEEVAQKVYAMTKARRDILSKNGLLSDNELDSWESTYENYIPLKGFANDEVDSSGKGIPRAGQGFAIRGNESIRALGRRTMAASPSTQVIQDLTESIIRHRKNEVGNAFLKLVNGNPNKEFWQVFTDSNPEIDRRYNKQTGRVEETRMPMAMMADQYFTTKVDGETHYIKIEDQRLMSAMKNLGVDKSNGVVQTLGTINRYLSTINTSFNPEFVISNMARDVQTAVFNVLAEQDLPQGKIKGKNIAKDMVKGWVHARKGISLSLSNKKIERDSNGKPTTKAGEYQELFEQFRQDGAKTGYFDMKDMDQQVSEINNMLEMSSDSKKGAVLRFAKKAGDFIENANQAVENAVRLSAYKEAIDAGISRQKAASLAKNLTVNFNRKGEAGTTMNALYMFANASVQGTAQFLRSMQGYRDTEGNYKFTGAQKAAAGFAAAGFALAAINRAFSDEDDDGVSFWDKVPDHVKERNIVVMKSVFGQDDKPGDYYSIPLPYGYNIFSVFGTSAESVAQGNKTTIEASSNIVGALIGSFSPIGSQGSGSTINGVVKSISPTIISPFVQLAVNENFYGGSIYRENYEFGTQRPDSSLAKRGTHEAYKAVASWLNDATGGSYYRSGVIDINPEVFAHLIDFTTGAAGTFVTRTANAGAKLSKGEDFDSREVPFYRKLNGEVNDSWGDQDKFYERGNLIKQSFDEYSSLKGSDRNEFKRENKGKLVMINHVKVTEKQLTALRKRYRAVEASKTISASAKIKQLETIRKHQDRLVDKFNLRYNTMNK
jgi:hypothetical protein